jgi:hypothetical protein
MAAALGCRAPQAAPAPAVPALPTSASANGSTIVAIAPPAQQCCPKQTLPQFLGLTGLVHGVGGLIDRIRNRLGAIWPGLEAKPEILAIADPANLNSSNPAVAEAAKVKADEDAAAQKAKALEYLATIGCGGCYPGVEQALLDGLDDCTEVVRFAAASALRKTAGEPCKKCRTGACCGPKIREKLEKIAYDRDANGCYIEPSERVRRQARLALCQCSSVPAKPAPEADRPLEGPTESDLPPPPADQTAQASSFAPPIGTGLVQQPYQAAPLAGLPAADYALPAAQRVGYEQSLHAYQLHGARRPVEPTEVVWEEWTARPDQFSSRTDALATMTMARTQALSPQPVPGMTPHVRQVSHDWTDPRSITSPAVARLVETTPVGGVSGVVEDNAGLHLVRIIARRNAASSIPATPPMQALPVGLPAPAGAPAVSVPAVTWRLPPCDCQR